MRTFFHLCLTALLSTVVLSAVEPDPLSFFPHHVGDTWVYQYYHGLISTTSVVQVTDSNDNTIVHRNGLGSYYRIDDNLNVYTRYNWLEYKLTAQKDETWIVRPDSEHTTRINAIVQDVYQTILFGKLTTVKKISYFRIAEGDSTITERSSYLYSQWLAAGIGLIKEIGEGSSEPEFVLTGCVINGDTLGIVTDVEEQQNVQPLSVAVSPNPCSLFANIRCTLPPGVTVAHLTITDIFGNSVYTTDIDNDQHTVNTSILPNGLYFCTLTVGVQTRTLSIVVQQ